LFLALARLILSALSAALLATLTRLLARVLGLLARVLVLATLLAALLAALVLLVHAIFPCVALASTRAHFVSFLTLGGKCFVQRITSFATDNRTALAVSRS
jgi:hypothetical protein